MVNPIKNCPLLRVHVHGSFYNITIYSTIYCMTMARLTQSVEYETLNIKVAGSVVMVMVSL